MLSRLILILLVFLVQKSLGQEEFNSDYIINKKGDTIYGTIEHQNEHPKTINLRGLQNKNVGKFTPKNIIAFKTNQSSYVSAIIQTDTDTIKTVFLQTLVEGNKSLYSYVDSNNKITYYIRQNSKYIILIYKNNTSEYIENNKFKGQLLYYLNDCSSIKSNIERSSYNTISLLNVFEKYYECMSILPTFKSNKKIKIETGVFIGVSNSSLKFDERKSLPYLNSKYKSSTNLSFGIYLELFLSKNKGWSLYNEIQYYNYNTSNQYENIENENIYTIIDTKIGHSIIKINNLARYNFSMANQLLYFNLGITNGWVIREENFRRIEDNVFSNQTISNGFAIPGVKNHEFGIIIGIGTKFKRLSFEARYESTFGVSNDSATSKLNKLFFLIGYRL